MQLDFFNTIHLKDEQLKKAVANVNTQGRRVLDIYRELKAATPYKIWVIYRAHYPDVPLTSIRRAITDLTNKGYLEKTNEMDEGPYDKPNYKWRLK